MFDPFQENGANNTASATVIAVIINSCRKIFGNFSQNGGRNFPFSEQKFPVARLQILIIQ